MDRLCFCRQEKHYHVCILVGVVTSGRPAAYYNRRVICIPRNSLRIDDGTFGGVKAGKGKIKDVELIRRITVRLEDHLDIVQNWAQEALQETGIGCPERVVIGVEARMAKAQTPSSGELMELDVFRGVIVNRSEDQVFVYKTPISSY